MYQPISYNTIRQAISWSNMPVPKSVRMVSNFKWPDGTVSGEYILAFEGWQIRDAWEVSDLYEGSAADTWSQMDLNNSFCNDVTVVRSWMDVQHDTWYCEMYCRVTAHPAGWQMPLFEEVD